LSSRTTKVPGNAEITAGMVRELRDKTSAPMMECKKALVEAGGNAAKARSSCGSDSATKRPGLRHHCGRGVVAVHITQDAKTGAIVEVNCETDFVAQTRTS